MRRPLSLTLWTLILSTLLISTGASARSKGPMRFDALNLDRLEAEICVATNEIRVAHGLKALPRSAPLAKAARGHASRMARLKFFGHDDPTDPARATPADRARLAGVSNPYIAENVAVRTGLRIGDGDAVYVVDRARGIFSTRPGGPQVPAHSYRSFAQAILDQWMASPGHRENILSGDGKQMGCGVALRYKQGMPRLYGVQMFQWFEGVKARPRATP